MPLRAGIHVFSFNITWRLQYCFLVGRKTLKHTRHLKKSFVNQLKTSQLSFFDKVRLYVFIHAQFYTFLVLFFIFIFPITWPKTQFKRAAKNIFSDSAIWEKMKRKKIQAGEDREWRETMYSVRALTGSNRIFLHRYRKRKKGNSQCLIF